ncbi:hypothetical protein C2869_21985 (plasmid) [Saccharobesus litoralis]|uniref:Uncharacterized protein n=1 Tax=Saccharobesus litoralis TaxID=2172099 RepID=A0A2S0VYC2_9ALTE|nr:hypothetical protein [Saccharobesus litoralis]AWB69175.1 hypothetical protein C2869_21985 [Saccharobesus litoralis]
MSSTVKAIALEKAGSILAIPVSFQWDTFIQEVQSLNDRKIIDDIDHQLFQSLNTLATTQTKTLNQPGDYHLVNIFYVFDLLESKPSNTKIGRSNRYNRLSKYKKLEFLYKVENEQRNDCLGVSKVNQKKEILLLNNVVSDLIPDPAPSALELFPDNQIIHNKNPDSQEITQALKTMHTQPIIGNIIGRTVPTSHLRAEKTKIIKIPVPVDGKTCHISVEASTLANSDMMDSDDLIAAECVYSHIREYVIDNRKKLRSSLPVKKTWLISISKLIELTLSRNQQYAGGKDKINFYKRLVRISSTEFLIDFSEIPKDSLLRAVFVNESGDIVDRQRLRLISIIDEVDAVQLEFTELMETKPKAIPSYISVALPPSIQLHVEEFVMNEGIEDAEFLPSFTREMILIKSKNAGFLWTLNNYIKSMLSRQGLTHGPMDLDRFLTNWKALSDTENRQKQIKDNKRYLFHHLLKPENCIAEQGSISAIRNARSDFLISMYDHVLYVIWTETPTNASPNLRRIINYKFWAINLDKKRSKQLVALRENNNVSAVLDMMEEMKIKPLSLNLPVQES